MKGGLALSTAPPKSQPKIINTQISLLILSLKDESMKNMSYVECPLGIKWGLELRNLPINIRLGKWDMDYKDLGMTDKNGNVKTNIPL